jgi:hypothetical protein
MHFEMLFKVKWRYVTTGKRDGWAMAWNLAFCIGIYLGGEFRRHSVNPYQLVT